MIFSSGWVLVLLILALAFVALFDFWRGAFWNVISLLYTRHAGREWAKEQARMGAESGARFAGMMPDEQAVAALLLDVPKLLTGDENRQLQEHAAAIIEHNAAAFEIVTRASERFGGASDQDAMNSREALARYLANMTTQPTLDRMNEIAEREANQAR